MRKWKGGFLLLLCLACLILPACGPKEPAAAGSCTLSVDCGDALRNPDSLPPEALELLPEDGMLLPETQAVFYEGDTAFDALRRTLEEKRLPMEFEGSPAYVTGIGNLYAGDAGEMSGWLYAVNGQSPDVGAAEYKLRDGDRLVWSYVCDFNAAF